MDSLEQHGQRGWRLGALSGVPVYLGRSWVIVAAAIVLLFGPIVQRVEPGLGLMGYVVAFSFAVLLLLSVLVHEAAHALTAQACGYSVTRIVADFWGGHTAYDGMGNTPGRSALVAVAGPGANAALAALGWLLGLLAPDGVTGLLVVGFTFSNGFVAAFNLLPGLPLDGGFLIDSLVWRLTGSRGTGTLVAGWSGRLLVIGLAWYAVGQPLVTDSGLTLSRVLWAGLIGSFLWMGASQAVRVGHTRRALEDRTVAALLRPALAVAVHTPLAEVDWSRSALWVATEPDGRPVGLLDPEAVSRVPVEARGQATVASVVRRQPTAWDVGVGLGDDLTGVVTAMQAMQSPVVVVRDGAGGVRGLVFAADL